MVGSDKLPEAHAGSPIARQEYKIAFILYSDDGERAAEVLEFHNGEIYLDEKERIEGAAFRNRHSGRVVGPFASVEDAEKFIVATTWFNGGAE
jgi:hypothetical protein